MDAAVLLVQLLPLLVFLIVDAVFNNTVISIIAAAAFAVGQTGFFYITTRQIDYFILLDAGLIITLGAVSLALKNDIFFKLKPALIEAVAVVFLLALIIAPSDFLVSYFSRYMNGRTLSPEQIEAMKRILLIMTVYVVVHIVAVVYTAYRTSRKVWAFVSGPGFYILFIPVMGYVLVKRAVRKQNA